MRLLYPRGGSETPLWRSTVYCTLWWFRQLEFCVLVSRVSSEVVAVALVVIFGSLVVTSEKTRSDFFAQAIVSP